MNTLTRQTVNTILNAQIKRAGSLRAYARQIGVSAAYLSDIRLGRREPGDKVLNALRLTKTVRVVRTVTYALAPQRARRKPSPPAPVAGLPKEDA